MSHKEVLHTKNAPEAIGPYSQGILAGKFLFLSGQIALDPTSGNLVGTTVRVQTEQCLKNIESVLKSKELSLNDVVKTTVFLKDLCQFSEFNEVYGRYFHNPYPARSTVEVSRLPKDALVEIETIAIQHC